MALASASVCQPAPPRQSSPSPQHDLPLERESRRQGGESQNRIDTRGLVDHTRSTAEGYSTESVSYMLFHNFRLMLSGIRSFKFLGVKRDAVCRAFESAGRYIAWSRVGAAGAACSVSKYERLYP